MSLDTFGVTQGDVLDAIPLDTSHVSATSKPIDTDDVDNAIDSAAADVAGALGVHDTDAVDLQDESEQQAQNAVLDGAVVQLLEEVGHTGAMHDKKQSRFERRLDRLRNSRNVDNPPNDVRVETTVDTIRQRDSDWLGDSDWTGP